MGIIGTTIGIIRNTFGIIRIGVITATDSGITIGDIGQRNSNQCHDATFELRAGSKNARP
jgi:hypothetical protein